MNMTWLVVWSTTWAISMTGYLGIEVGTIGRYLIWMAGHDSIDSLEGSSGCVKNVRSECTEYARERSPSYMKYTKAVEKNKLNGCDSLFCFFILPLFLCPEDPFFVPRFVRETFVQTGIN